MSDTPRIRKLKAQVKNFLELDDAGIMEWWITSNPAFGDKTPKKMAENPKSLAKMEKIVQFSTRGLMPKEGLKREKPRPPWKNHPEMDF